MSREWSIDPLVWIQQSLGGDPVQPWVPAADVLENADCILVRMDLPGVSVRDLEVHVTEQALVISGIRKNPCRGETGHGLRARQTELACGPFERILSLPCRIDGDSVTANLRQGVLELCLPKRSGMTAQSVHVSIELSS